MTLKLHLVLLSNATIQIAVTKPVFDFQEVEQPSSMVYVQASELFPKKTLTSGLWQISRCVIVIQGVKTVCCPELEVLRIYEKIAFLIFSSTFELPLGISV